LGSLAVGRWRESSSRVSRLPWLGTAFLLVPAVVLVLNYQANIAQDAHHAAADAVSVDQLTGPRDQTPDVR
jgi:hypothetical protein